MYVLNVSEEISVEDAKFGIYFHWGVYTVPEFSSEWYPRNMHLKDHKVYDYHLKNYGPPSKFGYHDFVPLFKAEEFDSDEWAKLFKKAGAKFAGPVAEHHDGFSMWASKISPWNVMDKGPKRDIMMELKNSINNMVLITSVIASPSIPSMKFIALTMIKNTNTVENWANNHGISYKPNKPL